MTTLHELAQELDTTIFELMAFAPDAITSDMRDASEIDDTTAATIRQAWAEAPDGPERTDVTNHNEDRLMDEVANVVDRAGYEDDLTTLG